MRIFLLLSLLCLWPGGATRSAAAAEPEHVPLGRLPAIRLRELGPLLRGTDLVLVESDGRGWQRQVTTITLCACAPQAMREVLIHPEHYGEFVRNMSKSTAERRPDGTLLHHYELRYSFVTTDGTNRYALLPDEPGHGAAPVEMFDVTGSSHYRWEFLPANSGGGTIVVLYGFSDFRHSDGFLQKVVAQADSLEYGLALVTQLTLLLSMKARSEQQPGDFVPYVSPLAGTRMPDYGFLLERGLLALLRSQDGRLASISLVDRTRARPEALLRVAGEPWSWSRFVPSIVRSRDTGRLDGDGTPTAELVQSLPHLSWKTVFGVRAAGDPRGVQLVGLEGDLRGAQLRWDVRPGRAGFTEVVLRATEHYDRANLLMRQLYRLEPLFEYGVNVGLGLVLLRAVEAQAERIFPGPGPGAGPR